MLQAGQAWCDERGSDECRRCKTTAKHAADERSAKGDAANASSDAPHDQERDCDDGKTSMKGKNAVACVLN